MSQRTDFNTNIQHTEPTTSNSGTISQTSTTLSSSTLLSNDGSRRANNDVKRSPSLNAFNQSPDSIDGQLTTISSNQSSPITPISTKGRQAGARNPLGAKLAEKFNKINLSFGEAASLDNASNNPTLVTSPIPQRKQQFNFNAASQEATNNTNANTSEPIASCSKILARLENEVRNTKPRQRPVQPPKPLKADQLYYHPSVFNEPIPRKPEYAPGESYPTLGTFFEFLNDSKSRLGNHRFFDTANLPPTPITKALATVDQLIENANNTRMNKK